MPLAFTIMSASRAASSERSAASSRVLVDDHLAQLGGSHVAMLLALVSVRLVKGDAMPAIVQRLDQAAIVSRRAVPIGREQAGRKERDVHRSSSYDREQFVHAMRAGVAGADRGKAVLSQLARHLFVG